VEEEIKRGEVDFSKYYVTDEMKNVLKEAYKRKKAAKKACMYVAGITVGGAILIGLIASLFADEKAGAFMLGAFLGGLVCFVIAMLLFKNIIKEYETYYLNNVPSKVASFIPIGVTNVNRSTGINYEATGLGELYRYSRKTYKSLLDFGLSNTEGDSAAGKLYSINLSQESVQKTGNTTKTSYDKVFSGYCYSLDVNNPVNCAVRIDSDETLTSHLTESTIESVSKNKGRFSFGSAELEKMFDCKVYPKGSSLANLIGSHTKKAVRDISVSATEGIVGGILGSTAIGKTLNAFGVGDVISNEINNISMADITSMFKSEAEMDDAMHEAKKIITPVTEEFLLYIRKKYGPFTLVINNGINIQISNDKTFLNNRNVGKGFFENSRNYMSGFLSTSVFSNSDLECSRLNKMYEVFMLEWLLNKYFKNLTNVDQFSIDGENRLYKDDTAFFEESLEFSKKSDGNIDKESEVKEVFKEICV
jgi:hypothetical protein